MTDCEFFGNCPEPEPTVEEEPMEEAPMEEAAMEGEMMMEDEDYSGWKKEKVLDPFMGNVSYAILAGVNLFGYATNLFRYEKDIDFKAGDSLRWFNSWKIYYYIE